MHISAVLLVVGTISLLTGIANAPNRRTSGAPRNGTITSVLDPIHVPKTLPELVALSPLIVVATSQGDAPSRFFVKGNFRSDVVTDRIVQVESVVKGTVAAGTVIAIEELGCGVSQYDGVHSLKQVIVNQRALHSRNIGTCYFYGRPHKPWATVSTGEGFLSQVSGRARLSW